MMAIPNLDIATADPPTAPQRDPEPEVSDANPFTPSLDQILQHTLRRRSGHTLACPSDCSNSSDEDHLRRVARLRPEGAHGSNCPSDCSRSLVEMHRSRWVDNSNWVTWTWPDPFPFMDLPAEMRLRVYRELMPPKNTIHLLETQGRTGPVFRQMLIAGHLFDYLNHPTNAAILQVSRTIYQEAKPVLYGENRFVFHAPKLDYDCISDLDHALYASKRRRPSYGTEIDYKEDLQGIPLFWQMNGSLMPFIRRCEFRVWLPSDTETGGYNLIRAWIKQAASLVGSQHNLLEIRVRLCDESCLDRSAGTNCLCRYENALDPKPVLDGDYRNTPSYGTSHQYILEPFHKINAVPKVIIDGDVSKEFASQLAGVMESSTPTVMKRQRQRRLVLAQESWPKGKLLIHHHGEDDDYNDPEFTWD